MITANELRVGNLIFWNPKLLSPNTTLAPIYVEVCEILKDKIGYISPGIEYRSESFEDDLLQRETSFKSFDELEPIILGSEILEKCGFTRVNNHVYTNKFLKNKDEFLELQINLADCKVCVRSATADQGVNLLYACKFLNHLQNLYLALTGEELEVRL